jgi:hypothetical protein
MDQGNKYYCRDSVTARLLVSVGHPVASLHSLCQGWARQLFAPQTKFVCGAKTPIFSLTGLRAGDPEVCRESPKGTCKGPSSINPQLNIGPQFFALTAKLVPRKRFIG